MQISKHTTPRARGEVPASEIIPPQQQAAFLALLQGGDAPAADERRADQHRPTAGREEAARFIMPTPMRPLPTAEQLCLRLTNGALAGMLIEARLQGGVLTLRLRMSEAQRGDRNSTWQAEMKRELASHPELPIHLEFVDDHAPTDQTDTARS
ncbi:hypothetical protein [Pseudomonas chlororaphis]|uniref:hypothetical protein n=1 Tax=Pseudomonas chlororaphis TaxID=587753 RepID=UPI0015DF15A9|nr:hypothetical protein [Pseudomonas chlororaphis]QLL13476.1 hypothetical protein H0I86_31730 [Pseudomonas chlororaphis subsp. aurantiaca]